MRKPLTGNRMTTACIYLNRRTYSVMIVWLTSGGVKYRSYIVTVVVPGSFLTVGMYDQKGNRQLQLGYSWSIGSGHPTTTSSRESQSRTDSFSTMASRF